MALNVHIRLLEETHYPFREAVKITISPAQPVQFPLHLRIPGWAEGATIHVNGKPQADPAPGSFAPIDRTWQPGDVVELHLPMRPRAINGYRDSLSIERGPIVFSYPIAESWLKLRDRGMTADWQVYPATQWNYALTEAQSGPDLLKVEELPFTKGVFTARSAPVKITTRARKLPRWRALNGAAEPVPQSPVESSEPDETITLIPYAAAKLRITAFPYLNSKPSQS